MFTRQLVLLFAGLLCPPIAECTPPARFQITARLYNTARVPDVVKKTALRVATDALSTGRIAVKWRNCDVAELCAMTPARGELVIRIVRSGGPVPGRTPLVLGEAFVDTRQRTGVLATVFADRVELLAGLSETDSALLLGRAIAHEVGHLLLGSNAHSLRGLMRAQWTPADIRRHARTDWELTRDDAAAIRKRLQ